jgi:hypothetical protein
LNPRDSNWAARRGAAGCRNYFWLAPFLDFLLVLTRDDVLRLKAFARESVSCSEIEVALQQRLGLSGGLTSSASESHAAVMEIMARE